MKSALFYFSNEKLSPEHQPIKLADGRTVYIRAYLGNRIDAERLLDCASPTNKETVLNSVDLD